MAIQFLVGRSLAQIAGIEDQARQNTYGLVSAVAGSSLPGLLAVNFLARNEAAAAAPAAPAVSPAPVAKVPDAPSSVAAMQLPGLPIINVSWGLPISDGGATITSYTVTALADEAAAGTTKVSATTTNFMFSGLKSGTRYIFKVAATNSAGTGKTASSDAVKVIMLPGAPTSVQARAGEDDAMVTWTAPADTGGSPITTYRITPYASGVEERWVTSNGTTTAARVHGLTPNTPYTFEVVAMNIAGQGPSGVSAAVTPGTGPAQPDVTAEAGDGQATVSWTAPDNRGSPITGYTVTPASPAGPGTPLPTLPPTATTATVPGLTNGTKYKFRVVASNSAGDSAPGISNEVTPKAGATPQAKLGSPGISSSTQEDKVPAEAKKT